MVQPLSVDDESHQAVSSQAPSIISGARAVSKVSVVIDELCITEDDADDRGLYVEENDCPIEDIDGLDNDRDSVFEYGTIAISAKEPEASDGSATVGGGNDIEHDPIQANAAEQTDGGDHIGHHTDRSYSSAAASTGQSEVAIATALNVSKSADANSGATPRQITDATSLDGTNDITSLSEEEKKLLRKASIRDKIIRSRLGEGHHFKELNADSDAEFGQQRRNLGVPTMQLTMPLQVPPRYMGKYTHI
jgi:hypothetical protein